MPSSTRSNKEAQLLFSPDPASLERSIRKETRSSSIDNTTCSSIDFCQPPSTHTLVPSTDTRSPLSTKDTHLPSTDIPHPTSINTSIRTLIDTEPRDMVATLILVRDNRGNLHDQEGHLRNAADVNFISGAGFQGSGNQGGNKNSYGNRVVKEEKLQEGDFEVESLMSFGGSHWRRPTSSHEHRSTEVIQNRSTSSPGHRSTTPTEPKPKPSENPPETVRTPSDDGVDPMEVDRTVRTPSDDGVDPMEVDRVPKGRTLRKRKEKVAKHLKRGANEKEKESFRKRVFRIPLDKPINEAYYTHRLWMFFRETRETKEDIERMLCEAREKMKMRITLKKKSDPEQFAIPCTVKGIEFPHALCDT
ncbi:hypothetical protein DY000_02053707 [Brassica cretica]|uniref:Uncharacterized protein n=1 Tax=Brassica cretica TaxID=69181 RepID=A0ABQ7AAI6_BRACR|nr:hypothetical protein DY000_02053707 [Brassica cretica]